MAPTKQKNKTQANGGFCLNEQPMLETTVTQTANTTNTIVLAYTTHVGNYKSYIAHVNNTC